MPARVHAAEPPELVVGSLRFEGVDAIPEGRIRDYVFVEARPWWRPWQDRPPFDPDVLPEDLERIEALYRRYGHYEARAGFEARQRPGEPVVDVVFQIAEGEPVRLAGRSIEVPALGGYPAGDPHWTDGLPLEPGDVFSLEDYGGARRELLARLAEAGHPRARIEGGADVDAATREARVAWRVDPGPAVRFGDVRVEGLARVDEALVRRRLEIEPGEAYSLESLRVAREELQSLGVFRSVIAQPLPGEGHEAPDGTLVWPVALRVSELAPRSVRAGIGWGTEDRLRLQAGWTHRNLFGGAERLALTARHSDLVREGEVDFQKPDWLVRDQTLTARLRVGRESTRAYDADRVIASGGVARDLGPRWSVRGGYEASWNAISSARAVAERVLEDPEQNVFLSGLRLGVRRSTVENRIDPRSGTWLDLSAAPWLPPLGSDLGFVELLAEGRVFRPVGPVVLAARLRIGSLVPFGGTRADEIPLTSRFYLGGASTMRGFDFQGLGPSDEDGKPVGGASLMDASVETRFPIRGPLGGVVFVDAGQVGRDPDGFDPSGLVVSVGAGLRYATPLGPVRIDLAFPVNPPESASTTFFHLSIGQAF